MQEDPLPMEVEIEAVDEDEEDMARHAEAMRGRAFNLKRLIRVLHISQPVQYVLCLLGKKWDFIFSFFSSLFLFLLSFRAGAPLKKDISI